MRRMLAPCGLICSECEAYTATQAKDTGAIAAVATEWSQRFGIPFGPDDIWCDGSAA